nr:putative ribonuclease H-like domain-containing protein [Tanacetum cinerariifolium]
MRPFGCPVTILNTLDLLVKEPEFEGNKPESKVHVSPSSSAQTKKHDDKTKRGAKDNSINEVNAAGTPVSTVVQISTNSTNNFSVAGPSNTAINNEDFHTCMFACFLSQEEPKRVHQALKDPSWIEAMQEELLQFKMQKVWVLVGLPNRKRAIVAYSDSDYAGSSLDKKSTTGGCQFLGCRLISWQCKKQTIVATSSTEAEYVAAAS